MRRAPKSKAKTTAGSRQSAHRARRGSPARSRKPPVVRQGPPEPAPVTGMLFITGATGAVGEELLERYLKAGGDGHIRVLVRGKDGGEARAKWDALLASCPSWTPSMTRRVKMVRGDVTAGPGLGISAADAGELRSEITRIIHSAALTRFSAALEESLAINTEGARNTLDFAQRCRGLRRMAFLSTVFVAGKRTGVIHEDELEHEAGFVNAYEHSKFEAERLVRARWEDLPVAVYRLSTLLGDARDGTVRRFNAVHQSLKLLYHSLAPMMPGAPDTHVDLIAVDHVADAIVYLLEHTFTPGKTYHLCSGNAKCYTIDHMLDESMRLFQKYSPAWSRRTIAKPALVDLPTFELFSRSVDETGNDILKQVLDALKFFAPQLVYPKEFDRTRACAELDPVGLTVPSMDAYFEPVIRYCMEHRWGARRTAGETRPD